MQGLGWVVSMVAIGWGNCYLVFFCCRLFAAVSFLLFIEKKFNSLYSIDESSS